LLIPSRSYESLYILFCFHHNLSLEKKYLKTLFHAKSHFILSLQFNSSLPSIPLSIQIKDSEAQSNTFPSPPKLLAFAVIVDVSDECHISAIEYAQKVLLYVSTLLAQVVGHSLRTQLRLTSRSEEKLTWHHAYSKSHVGQISYHNYKSQNATFSSNL